LYPSRLESIHYFETLDLPVVDKKVAARLIKEISVRLKISRWVGLPYLTLDRLSSTLSGENLRELIYANSLEVILVGQCTFWMNQALDFIRVIQPVNQSIKETRDLGNTVMVVEHEGKLFRKQMWIIDMGLKPEDWVVTVVLQVGSILSDQ